MKFCNAFVNNCLIWKLNAEAAILIRSFSLHNVEVNVLIFGKTAALGIIKSHYSMLECFQMANI